MNVREVLPKDAIPSVDDPEFHGTHDDPDEQVVAVELDGEARAYPLRYLDYHEVVNDRYGDRPVAVTWCPLCGSAVVYEARVAGHELTFGVSGDLADDDLVLYDRQTDSRWKQSSGVAISGELEGTELKALPAAVTTWAAFREANPDGRLLAPPGGESETASPTDDPAAVDYGERPFDEYLATEGFGLDAHRTGEGSRGWDRDDLDAKTVVLGIEADGEAVGFPVPRVKNAGGVVTATVGDQAAVVFATKAGIHAFADPGHEFVATDEGVRADGTIWNGATGESADGRRLERLSARRLFAFTWQDDHGADAFWTNDR